MSWSYMADAMPALGMLAGHCLYWQQREDKAGRQANNFVRQRPSVMSLSHLPILTNEPTEKRGTGCPVRPAKPTGFFFFLHKPVTI